MDINNLTFVRMVDKQVRDALDTVEVAMLPDARSAVADAGLKLGSYPIEGRYGKSPELAFYFNHIRTLQRNYSERVTKPVERLHRFYSHEVFGLGQAVPTAINPTDVFYRDEPPAVISPCVDPLTVAMLEVAGDPTTIKSDLTIPRIAEALENTDPGKCLVGLGAASDKADRRGTGMHNPVATTLTRETTVLSAFVPTSRGIDIHRYMVSPEVEEQGNTVIDAYNRLFKEFGFEVRIPNITESNASRFMHELPDMDRCVRIYNVDIPGMPPEYYHWAVTGGNGGPMVVDFWDREVVTTDMYRENPGKYAMARVSGNPATRKRVHGEIIAESGTWEERGEPEFPTERDLALVGLSADDYKRMEAIGLELCLSADETRFILQLPTLPPQDFDPNNVQGVHQTIGRFKGLRLVTTEGVPGVAYATTLGEKGGIMVFEKEGHVYIIDTVSDEETRLRYEPNRDIRKWIRKCESFIGPALREIGFSSIMFEYNAKTRELNFRSGDGEVVHTQPLALPEGISLEILPGNVSNYLKFTGTDFKPPMNYNEKTSDFLIVGIESCGLANKSLACDCLGSYDYMGSGMIQDNLDSALRTEW